MSNFSKFLLLVQALYLTLLLSGCKKERCGGDMRMFGDQFLKEEISGRITHNDYPNTIIFIDSIGNNFEFDKVINETKVERVEPGYFGECDSGLAFTPFYNRENFELTYVSSEGIDTISLIVVTRASTLTTTENSLMPDNQRQRGRERLFVKLSIRGCPRINTFQLLEDSGGMSVINSVPFARSKFQQSYEDTYGLRQGWSNEVWFSYSKGIVAFNYCGRNYAQVVD